MAVKGKRNVNWSCWKDLEMNSLNVDMVSFILREHKTCEICARHNTTKMKDATNLVKSETASVSYQQPVSPGGPFCGNLGVS